MNTIPEANIAYGKDYLRLKMDPSIAHWELIQPTIEPPLDNAREIFADLCAKPVGCPPLKEIVRPGDSVVIVTSDGTRAVPNQLLIPWILDELPVPAEQVVVLLGTGTHRPNTPEEIDKMFGPETVRRVQIVNHDCFKPEVNPCVGRTSTGAYTRIDKLYVEADKRIAVGFIEPHFFAGFSGGAKGIVPGIASLDTIYRIHRADLIADPNSTWGLLDENPLRNEIEEMVGLCPPDFMVNVTLNLKKEISAFFVGHFQTAHRPGCEHVRKTAMRAVEKKFPIVITSNSGYPLDQNLYQTVKGLSAAARIVAEGGTIFVASECSDGVPAHGNFSTLMQVGHSAQDILDHIFGLSSHVMDQWQAQTLAGVMKKAEVAIYSSMDRETLSSCKLRPVENLQEAVEAKIRELGKGVSVAVLPDGPLNIAYVK